MLLRKASRDEQHCIYDPALELERYVLNAGTLSINATKSSFHSFSAVSQGHPEFQQEGLGESNKLSKDLPVFAHRYA